MQNGFSFLYRTIPNSQLVISSIKNSELYLSSDLTNGAYGWLGGQIPNRENYTSAIRLYPPDKLYHYFH